MPTDSIPCYSDAKSTLLVPLTLTRLRKPNTKIWILFKLFLSSLFLPRQE